MATAKYTNTPIPTDQFIDDVHLTLSPCEALYLMALVESTYWCYESSAIYEALRDLPNGEAVRNSVAYELKRKELSK